MIALTLLFLIYFFIVAPLTNNWPYNADGELIIAQLRGILPTSRLRTKAGNETANHSEGDAIKGKEQDGDGIVFRGDASGWDAFDYMEKPVIAPMHGAPNVLVTPGSMPMNTSTAIALPNMDSIVGESAISWVLGG